MPTVVRNFCPECHGARQVHYSVYDRTKVPLVELHKQTDAAWLKSKLNADFTCKVANEAVTCRICGGSGNA